MLHTDMGMFVLPCWPTEMPCGWMLARHALTYQSGWLSPRQVREPTDMRHTYLPDLLSQMWALPARPGRHPPPARLPTSASLAMARRPGAGHRLSPAGSLRC